VFTELHPGRLEGLHSGGGSGRRRVFTDGKRLVTDGPFAETREQLGGYTLIEANDPDEAINIAAGYLGDGTTASIEVRPVVELAGSPVKAV
jgi:hypothetical protein